MIEREGKWKKIIE